MNNSRNVNNTSLLEQIRALAFVKTELELYLDTHPNCRAALDYYENTVNELNEKIAEYEDKNSPLTAEGAAGAERWTWVDTPWPWQAGTATPKDVR